MFLYFTLLISNEHFLQGNPIIFLEKNEDKKNGRRSITVMIESLPAPYLVQWSAKNKDDEHYTPIDINTEEYEGTTVSFPHPVLVVRQKDQLEKKCFKIEVTNFIGKTVHEISGLYVILKSLTMYFQFISNLSRCKMTTTYREMYHKSERFLREIFILN